MLSMSIERFRGYERFGDYENTKIEIRGVLIIFERLRRIAHH